MARAKMNDRLRPAKALAVCVFNLKRQVHFGSLISGGWFSASPDDVCVHRSIRTNNPGALNWSVWQTTRSGYIGRTAADSAGNRTSIYQTPEDGVSAWYYLFITIYGFGPKGTFTIEQAAREYAGAQATEKAIQNYLDGWQKWSDGKLQPQTVVKLSEKRSVLTFGRALFAHESNSVSPISDAQIMAGLSLVAS